MLKRVLGGGYNRKKKKREKKKEERKMQKCNFWEERYLESYSFPERKFELSVLGIILGIGSPSLRHSNTFTSLFKGFVTTLVQSSTFCSGALVYFTKGRAGRLKASKLTFISA